MRNAVVTFYFDNEVKTDTIASMEDKGLFVNVPRRFIGKDVCVSVKCKDFFDLDTVMTLQENMTLFVSRDTTVYGNVNFRLWNSNTETAVSNCKVEIQGQKTVSDDEGRVNIIIPLALQRPAYMVLAAVPLEDSILYMPSGADVVILTK